MPSMAKHHFKLLADYHQFYIQDEAAEGDLSDSWTEDATNRLLATAPGTVGVGTARNMTVPVDIELLDAERHESFDGWDQVNECSIQIKSGTIVVAGCTDYFPDAARIKIAPGVYRVRIFYGKLDKLSDDGLEGEDHYRVVLWPGALTDPIILKQRTTLS